MLAVPSGMVKCTPPPDGGVVVVDISFGILKVLGRKEAVLCAVFLRCLPHHFLQAANHSEAALGNTQLLRRANCHVHGTDQTNRS